MKRTLLVLLFAVVWSGVTIVSMTWATTYNDPDNLHVNYGLPQAWAVHELNSIAGATDVWGVDVQSVMVDLVFWLGLMTVGVIVALRVGAKSTF